VSQSETFGEKLKGEKTRFLEGKPPPGKSSFSKIHRKTGGKKWRHGGWAEGGGGGAKFTKTKRGRFSTKKKKNGTPQSAY